MKRLKKLSIIIVSCILICGISAVAAGTVTLVETHTNEEDFSVYIKGIQPEDEMSVQIATSQAQKVEMAYLSKLDMPMQTLIMIDNSISIPTSDRSRISDMLLNLIADRLANEQIAISTFSEDVNMLTEYTNDYSVLKKALESVTYQDQETYLTDVLYDLISEEYVNSSDDVYRRIIVVSDGVDNKSIGYTKDELNTLLKEYPIPIYSVGCQTGKNNTELENMFAISRSTSAQYYLLDDIEDTLDITDDLRQDRDIVKVTITPSEEMMDGSKKTVKISSGGSALSMNITMPQKYKEEQTKETEVAVVKQEEPESPVVEAVEQEEPKSGPNIGLIIGIVAAVIVVIAVIVVVIVISMKKKRKVEFEQADDAVLNKFANRDAVDYSATEMMDSGAVDDGNTVAILDQISTYQMVLTDVNSPTKSFRVPLNNSVTIGRKRELCNLVLDYDTSVSGRHCEISARGGKFYVKDLQSKNGTYINNSKVLSETEIFSGNILKIGRLEMKFEVR
jgi:hypothetical protein